MQNGRTISTPPTSNISAWAIFTSSAMRASLIPVLCMLPGCGVCSSRFPVFAHAQTRIITEVNRLFRKHHLDAVADRIGGFAAHVFWRVLVESDPGRTAQHQYPA